MAALMPELTIVVRIAAVQFYNLKVTLDQHGEEINEEAHWYGIIFITRKPNRYLYPNDLAEALPSILVIPME